jgi:hypothetical protein
MGVTHIAHADPEEILIQTVSGGGTSLFSLVHTFGSSDTYGSSVYPMTVSSGLSDREDWDYEVTWDLTAFDTSFFDPDDTFNVLMEIKADDTDSPISEISVKDAAGNETDAWIDLTGTGTGHTNGSISLGVIFEIIQPSGSGNEFFTIQWNQVPAPGAMALIGLAALAGRRRRR